MASKAPAKPLSANKPVVAKPAAPKTPAAKPVVTKAAPSKPAIKPAPKKATPAPATVKKTGPTASIKVVNKAATAPAKDKAKSNKVKMERDSFTMPKEEYAQIATLKKRLENLAKPAKKSELLRAGLKLLAAMDDATLLATMGAVPTIKTGRPAK